MLIRCYRLDHCKRLILFKNPIPCYRLARCNRLTRCKRLIGCNRLGCCKRLTRCKRPILFKNLIPCYRLARCKRLTRCYRLPYCFRLGRCKRLIGCKRLTRIFGLTFWSAQITYLTRGTIVSSGYPTIWIDPIGSLVGLTFWRMDLYDWPNSKAHKL